ncbi:MAG: CRISPR system precrRNA processing endoribonuclease RAMP protein Cas6 [Pseudomonadota bacterium]
MALLSTTLLQLPVGCYRCKIVVLDPLYLPEYAGSAWRGIFGHALKRTVCVTRERDCSPCLLYRSCAYPYIFETSPPADTERMRLYNSVPHPFLISPTPSTARCSDPGAAIELDVMLFGRSNAYLPYVIHAFRMAGERGIGRGKGRFELAAWMQRRDRAGIEQWHTIWRLQGRLEAQDPSVPEVPDCPETVLLDFCAPLRLKREGHLVTPESFEFHDLYRNLLRRISMLMYFHAHHKLEADFAGLSQASRSVEIVHKELRWKEWTRYSSRQHTEMQMGGLLGHIELEGVGLEPFWPYLWLGQWTHAGKGTSMGLGRYTIRGTPDQENT